MPHTDTRSRRARFRDSSEQYARSLIALIFIGVIVLFFLWFGLTHLEKAP